MLNLLALTLVGCSIAIIVDSVRISKNLLEFLIEIIVALLGVGFGFGLVKLLVYHIELGLNRLTTNEDLKGTYEAVRGEVSFPRCQKPSPPILDIQVKLVRADSYEMETHRFSMTKGKRYSTLVSDRQSVLNSLVEQQL